MSSRSEILKRYKAYEQDPRKVKKKKPKQTNMIIVEDVDDWGEREEVESPVVIPSVDYEAQFKRHTFNVVQDDTRLLDSERRSPSREKRRRSPSLSPKEKRRRSPSPDKVARRRSPSFSPKEKRRRSPSIDRMDRRRSPSLSPKEQRRRSPSPDMVGRRNSPSGEKRNTIYRDKTGRKIDMESKKAEASLQDQKLKQLKEEHSRWGRGLVQEQEEEEQIKRLEEEQSRNFAVYKDDAVYNDELKDRVRWGDTMTPLLKKRKKKSKYEYQGPPPPPNRFGIKPGYRWDGIDRSNGFEAKLFQSQKQHEEKQKEYHRWATEDM